MAIATLQTELTVPADIVIHARPAPRDDLGVQHGDLIRRWDELAWDAATCDRYELSEFGECIVSPKPTPGHQSVAFEVGHQLTLQLGRRAATEVPVLTDRGVRVPDVIWMPPERWPESQHYSPLRILPDVCVEVLSLGNTREEIAMKTTAYLRGGAREVIVVGLKGEVEFFGPEGRRETSALGIRLELPPEMF
jgi:Uma2 family endonuclease